MSKNLNKLTIHRAIEGLKNKEFTILELVTDCFLQIEKYDSQIKAFITLTKDYALQKAKEYDLELDKKGSIIFNDKPLFGIPYASKDNYSTKDILTTASSKILNNYYPPFDATAIKKLNDAGAILIGKTNLDAFAHGSSTETSDFFTTKNPWNTKKVPGGSSGGSAAAVSCDMCLFATASETGGSTRGPASWCGVTGVKPSYGRVSRYGIVAMASSTDCPGPITKDILDSALVLKIMAGKDDYDATSTLLEVPNYVEDIKKYSLNKVKIGKPKSYFNIDIDLNTKKIIDNAVNVFLQLGATVYEIDLLDPKYSIAVYTILQRSEVSSNLARITGVRYGHSRDNFGFEAKKRIMLGTYALSSGYYDAYYLKALKVRTLIVEDFKKAFEKVDLIIAPSMPCVAMDLGANNTSSMFGEMIDMLNEPSCIAGNPGASVPCGFFNGLPVGIQIIGKINDESSVLGALNKYQEVTNFHLLKPF